ncbi:MAG TPA: YitT family protein [Spirochaetota bacterium]|nr:YitT family protein [Spirochaetota bacterium]HOS32034.1 YitT family protein [Spirochaetota bacterium]HOS55018.1 YitT family protein [Spirochaetota bacterium]HPK60999.1 YitT family protein [Spirochaetota bacterium]HQF77565.1 YitT family protein [Spirochaetota bacterium]
MREKRKKIFGFIFSAMALIVGSAICAVSVNGILIPNGFLSSGLTGVALVIHYLKPTISVGVIYLLINIPIFILGWIFVGKRFILFTALGMVIFSITLHFVNFTIPVTDKMLAAMLGGAITGVGVAIMLKSYGSSGGSEIISIILYKYFSITLGTGILMVNSVIMAISLFLFPLEKILYTLIYIVVSSRTTNMIFHGLTKRQAALIVSEKWKEILEELTVENRIGVTLISGKGGYQGNDKTILYSVINRNKVALLKKLVTTIDKTAFIAIIEASDVTGVEVGNQPHW